VNARCIVQHLEETAHVLRAVLHAHDGAASESLRIGSIRLWKSEHIFEDLRLRSEDAEIDTEECRLSTDDERAVIEPDVGRVLKLLDNMGGH
jgi:hypothetical protein